MEKFVVSVLNQFCKMNNFWEINVSLVIVLEENKFSHSFLASDPTRERERDGETCEDMQSDASCGSVVRVAGVQPGVRVPEHISHNCLQTSLHTWRR